MQSSMAERIPIAERERGDKSAGHDRPPMAGLVREQAKVGGLPVYLKAAPPAPNAAAGQPASQGGLPRFLREDEGLSVELSHPGGGLSLDPAREKGFEAALHTDLSTVRLHTDHRADRLAKVLNARAFTCGNHIFFRAGCFDPGSRAGDRLLAHETVHTVQQARQSPRPAGGWVAGATGSTVGVASADDPLEHQADTMAESMLSREVLGRRGQDISGRERRQEGAGDGWRPHTGAATDFTAGVVQRQKVQEAGTTGLESYLPGLYARLETEFEQNRRRKAKAELDKLIARIKQLRDLRLRVQEAANALSIRQAFGESLSKKEVEQLAHLNRRLEDLKRDIDGLQQQAIEQAVIAYEIDTSHVKSIKRSDNEELITEGRGKMGQLDTRTGEVHIFGPAFESAETLGSVIGHEAEAHGRQATGFRSYVGYKGTPTLGFKLNEIEARDYEIRNAQRFGTSQQHLERARKFRDELYKELPPKYQERVDRGDYSVDSEDLKNEEIAKPTYLEESENEP